MAEVRISERRDENETLTHKMCCICFKMTPVEELYVDANGQKWDVCSLKCWERSQ